MQRRIRSQNLLEDPSDRRAQSAKFRYDDTYSRVGVRGNATACPLGHRANLMQYIGITR
jgi:hypothetical protein